VLRLLYAAEDCGVASATFVCADIRRHCRTAGLPNCRIVLGCNVPSKREKN
jgi:hypothetical protein